MGPRRWARPLLATAMCSPVRGGASRLFPSLHEMEKVFLGAWEQPPAGLPQLPWVTTLSDLSSIDP